MITYRHVKNPKKTLEVDESETTRIEWLDRTPRWQRVEAPKPPKAKEGAEFTNPFTDLTIADDIAESLVNGGFKDVDSLRKATDEELLALPKVGKGRLKEIREQLGVSE